MRFKKLVQAAALTGSFVITGQFALSFQPPTGAPAGQGKAPPPNPNAVSAIEFLIDPPTLINLGFEWFIQGDENRNAAVSVSYRKKGETDWKDALPMLRLKEERVYMASQVDVIAPNMFAGSILDLEPDTAYEAQFVLADPDGVRGDSRRTVTVRTRPEPKPYEGGRVLHVYPHGFAGQKTEPSFEGLMCAYNASCAGTDWATAGRPRVHPGDMILVHAGEYKYNRYEYTNNASVNRTTPLDGTYYLTADGTAEMPIAIKAAGDGPVIFDGAGNYALFDVRAADYTYFEGLTFRNTEIAVLAGTQFLLGSKGLTAKRNRFENVGAGIFTNYSGSSNFYIADNVFLGRNDPNHLIGWASPNLWQRFAGVEGQIFPPKMGSYAAVKLYGPGHVVAYNYIADFHDGINIETYGNPDGSVASGPDIGDGPKYPPHEYWDRRPVAIDFYNNYITNSHDNPIEADGGMHNIRILRNMLINHPSHAFCNQPSLGGASLLDTEHRLQSPRRLDAPHQRFGGRDLLQQHDSRGDYSQSAEQSLAKQSDAGSELQSADLQRDHEHELHLVGLQRFPSESQRGHVVPLGLAPAECRHGSAGPWKESPASESPVRHLAGVQSGNRTGPQQCPCGLRHLRQGSPSGCE